LQLSGKGNRPASSSVNFSGFTVLIEPSVSYITFGYESSSTNGLTKYNGSAIFGSSEKISFQARVPINGWNNSNIIIGQFKELMTIPNVTKPKMYAANIECDGSSQILSQIGAIASSISNISTGICNLTIPSTTFADYTKVTCTGVYKGSLGSGNIRNLGIELTSSTNLQVDCVQPSADCSSYVAGITCVGESL
jgi:hypothetical protein